MKYTLIAAVVVLALAQGSFAQDASMAEHLTRYFEELKTKMTEDFTALVNNQELTSKASTLLQDGKTKLEPLVAQVQEQIQALSSSVQEQMKPLTDNAQTQIRPVLENLQKTMEDMIKQLSDQAQAIGN
ncbi:unnamed protein product [Ophioblennius macclurei]